MRALFLASILSMVIAFTSVEALAVGTTSSDSSDCIECHQDFTPGIVVEWERSLHSQRTPKRAREVADELERRISAESTPEETEKFVVGCAECHLLNPEKHEDTFEHNGFQVHVVVTPDDCAVCHPVERDQYAENLMANAYHNLMSNPLYKDMANAINGTRVHSDGDITIKEPSDLTEADSCLMCHGTIVTVDGMETKNTLMGEMDFPKLIGWPNQGVGRINPDGSKGACTACHTRHEFSIAMARKPETCGQCHKGPDVPAYSVYKVSKHGNLYSSASSKWDFEAVPWKLGEDFTAPTCASCHISLLTFSGEVIAERTHRMNDRLSWRIFGLPYAHARPISPDTTIIKNKAGLPLPTELSGEPVSEYLLSDEEMAQSRETIQTICLACHSTQWKDGFFTKLDSTIEVTNEITKAATALVAQAWEKGYANGPATGGSPFDEAIEMKWVKSWLFYANSTRFAAAMGGADYGVFQNGRFQLSETIEEMKDWLKIMEMMTPPSDEK
ncbi:MAG: hydroxylamine oxidase [Deltaproteobacteria bacterium]|nr:MAG: hydroxylamine oxidase [Deltaproteobacteria bacterium]